MTKQEFIKKVYEINTSVSKEEDVKISDDEYAIIETVYVWHPSISNENGKDEIARLYCFYGWALIMDMLPRARVFQNIEHERAKINQSLLKLEEEACLARSGDLSEVNEVFRDF